MIQKCFDVEGLREKNKYYDRALEEIDNNIGRIIATLKTQITSTVTNETLLDNTMIIFTSDNGAENGIHLEYEYEATGLNNNMTGGFRGGYRFLYEGGTRVPFVAYWKNKWMKPSTALGQLADLTDIFSTIAHYGKVESDLTPTITVDGKDLSELLEYNKQHNKVFMPTYIEARESVNPCEYEESGCIKLNEDWTQKPVVETQTTSTHTYSYPHIVQLFEANPISPNVNGYKLFLDFDLTPRELYDLSTNKDESIVNNKLESADPEIVSKLTATADFYVKTLAEEPMHFFFPISEIQQEELTGDFSGLSANNNVLSIRGRDTDKKLQARILFYKKGGVNPGQDPVGYRNVYLKENEIFYSAINDICDPNVTDPKKKCYPYGDIDGSAVHSFPDFSEGAIAVHTSAAADVTIINKGLDYSTGSSALVAKNNRRSTVPRTTNYLPKLYDGFIVAGPSGFGNVSYENELVIWNANNKEANARITWYNGAGVSLEVITKTISAYGRVKYRPKEIFNKTSVSGSLKIESVDAGTPLAVNLLMRLKLGNSLGKLGDVSVYQHSDPVSELYFPLIKDGKEGSSAKEEYSQLITVHNPNSVAVKKIKIWFSDKPNEPFTITPPQVIGQNGKYGFRPSDIYSLSTTSYYVGSVKVQAFSDEGCQIVQPIIGFYDTTYYNYVDAGKYDIAYDIYSSSPVTSNTKNKLIFPRISNNTTEKTTLRLFNPSPSEVHYTVDIYNYSVSTYQKIEPTKEYSEVSLSSLGAIVLSLPAELNNGAVIVTVANPEAAAITGSAMAEATPSGSITAISTIEPVVSK